jgi:HEAT repeat protein
MLHDATFCGLQKRALIPSVSLFTLICILPANAARDAAPTAPRLVSKRLDTLSEDELRNRLANAPQIGLRRDEMDILIDRYANKFSGGRPGHLEPKTLLGVRPDLKQLPIRRGAYSRISVFDAAELTELSQKLKLYLQLAVPKDMRGRRPDPARLREAMRNEKRGGTSPWLRPAAVPILFQQLGHEDLPLRMMLVELLSEIPGKDATIALARRAVFDLAPAAREAALKALVERPKDEVREVLLYGLSYPWSPAAEHAAEALVALKDREAVPEMVGLLQKPEPNSPYLSDKDRLMTREVIRITHQANCLICHPPAITLADPVPGIVPGVTLAVPPRAPGGYGFTPLSLPQTKPLWIRADVAFVRQDFTIQLAALANMPGMSLPASVRTDFLVRERPLTESEIKRHQSKHLSSEPSPQRQALLFALRELSGKNLGTSFEDWRVLAPSVDPDAEAKALTEKLLQGSVARRQALLVKLQDGNNHGYTEALARAASKLNGVAQGNAREALIARLSRMPTAALRDRLRDEDEEIQRAAIRASAHKNDKALVPDLIALVAEGEPENARLASRSLRTLTSQDIGPTGEAPPEQWASAALAWEYWWKRQPEGK